MSLYRRKLPAETIKKAKDEAKRIGVTYSALVEHALTRALEAGPAEAEGRDLGVTAAASQGTRTDSPTPAGSCP